RLCTVHGCRGRATRIDERCSENPVRIASREGPTVDLAGSGASPTGAGSGQEQGQPLTHPMSVDWVDGCTRLRACPVCRAAGDKAVPLRAAIPGSARPVSLLLCPVCGSGAFDDLPPAPDYLPSAGAFQFYVEQGAGIDIMLGPLCRFPRERVKRYLEIGCGV